VLFTGVRKFPPTQPVTDVLVAGDESSAESAPRGAATSECRARICVGCGEPIREILEARPEHCFVCAVHVACACADEP